MKRRRYYLAIDIGASSGRHIVSDGEGGLWEVYRFDTGFTEKDGHLVLDVKKLFENVLFGVKAAFASFPSLTSLAIDTWGVDYVLMKGDEEILPVYAYRDSRTQEVIPEVHKILPFETLYDRTGIQFQPFNTIYQLYADKKTGRLKEATDFLLLPEYLSYKLTDKKRHEYTNATTGGMVNAVTGEYDENILSSLGLPSRLFHPLSSPGTTVGPLSEEVAALVGGTCQVILCASHDTASAVEGIPMEERELYISSGTWSLLGVKTEKAITGEASRKANFSNEGGVGYFRYQKNIMGMWVVNNLRKELCPDKSFAEIEKEAQNSHYDKTVNVDEKRFLAPKSMVLAFEEALGETNLAEEDYFNCAFRSLAGCYARAVREVEENTKKTYRKIYIVGGGAKNAYLNALTERATGKQVVALPLEATALGNLKLQKEKNP